MPRLEGGPKALSNQLKSRGLQRLRFYCQVCEKQCRDDNSFKQHCLSESHVRRLQLVGEDPQKYIRQYTESLKRDFLQLLRTSHGEKAVPLNAFYQTYIADKQHIHLNATRFKSLTEFAKYLGQEGICRITEEEGTGLFIAWIDNSPEALRRRNAVKRMERQDKNDEKLEPKDIQAQIERAWQATNLAQDNTLEEDKGILEEKEVQTFKLPQRQQDKQVKSGKRKNVFSSSKRQPGAAKESPHASDVNTDLSSDYPDTTKRMKV